MDLGENDFKKFTFFLILFGTAIAHLFRGGIWGRFCDTFALGNTYKGSVLPVFQVRVRAKLASMVFTCVSLVIVSSFLTIINFY